MRLVSINNIEKKDVPLYYRNEYSADSAFTLIGEKAVNIPITFSIEMAPTGEKNIDIQLKQSIDYPLVPLLRTLKEEISSMEKKGLLR